MQHISENEIKQIATSLQQQKKQWHFHLLTPDCMLNATDRFVLVVEDKESGEVYDYTANVAPTETSKMLLELLHGEQIFNEEKEELGEMSEDVEHMMQRGKELNEKGYFWHHHVLFPYCTYNKHQGKWVIVFEDPEMKEMIESISGTEPKRDMKEIEPAFYRQEVASTKQEVS